MQLLVPAFQANIWVFKCSFERNRQTIDKSSYYILEGYVNTIMFNSSSTCCQYRHSSDNMLSTRARARVCVCRCVCVYTLPRVGFFRLHDVFDISEKFGSMISYCEYSGGFCEVPSSLFLNLFYFTSKDENSSHRLLERKRYNTMFGIRRKDDIYWYTI